MANNNELLLQLVIKAVDLASKDIEGVHEKLEKLSAVISSNEFSRSAEGMRSFGDAVKDSTEPLAAAAKNTLALSAAMTGVASYMASNAYKAAKDYESALADLAKVLDGGKEEAKSYGDQLNHLALRYSQNGQELVAAMANFVQAGYSAKEAFDLVEQSVKLMIAGELNAAQSSEYLVSILKGFKAPASDAARTVDLLNEVSNKYATDVKELAIGMAGISPIAKQMGFSMAETAGLLTPVIEVYQSGSEAADALKTGLQKLTDTAVPVREALSSIGVSQIDTNGKLRQGKDILLDVSKAMVGLDDAQKQFVIGQLVGIEQAGRMSQVFSNLAGYLGVTDAALNSAGSAMKEVETRLETAESKGRKAEESFRQLSVTIGNVFKPQISGVIAATGDLAAAFDKAVTAGDLAPLLNAIKPQISAVENLIKALANNLDDALKGVDWTPLVDGIKAFSSEFGDAMAALTDGMDLSTIGGLRDLLQALINLMGNFSQYVAGVVDGLEPFLDSLNVLFAAISTNLPAFSNLAGQMAGLATSANQTIPVITELGGKIFGAVGFVVELTFKIGLLVGALKLLSAAGIPVGAMLGGLVTRFLALNPAVAGALSALAGLPGLVVGLTAAAGGLGYALGDVVNKTVEWASGGRSIGTMLYDWIHSTDDAERGLNKLATAEERAAAAAKIHAAELKAKQDAEEAAAKAAAAAEKAQTDKIARNYEETESTRRLKAQYAALGMVWDEVTGEITHQNELSAAQKRANLELAAALDKVGVDAGVMSNRMTQAGEDMLKALNGIASNTQATGKEVNAAILAMIPKMETTAELDALKVKIEEIGKKGKLTGSQIQSAMELIGGRISEVSKNPAFDALIKHFEKNTTAAQQYAQGVEDVVDAQTAGIRAELELAKAKGHTASVQELTRKLAIAEAEGAARVAKAKEAEQVAEFNLAVAKRNQVAAIANKTEAQKADLALAELVVQKELAEAQAAGVNAEALGILAEKIRTINILKTDSIQRLTEVTDDNTDTTEQNTDAQKKSTEAIEDGGSAISGQWAKWGDLTESMSDATHQMFLAIAQQNLWNFGMNQGADAIKTYKKELSGQTEGIQNANAAIADLTAQLQQSELSMMRQGHAAANISRATESIENAGIKAALAYQKQRLELENLIYAVEQGEGSVQQLNKATHYADTAFNLLGDEDLSRLRAAIADAKSKMDGLRQASADALDEAQRALLQQQGDDLALAELERKKTVLDLQKQLNAAQAAGDKDAITNLEKAISLQNQVFDMKTKDIQQAAQTREREKATASSPAATASPAPSKTYQLDLVGTNGRTFTATSAMDPSAFLDELETAKRRSMSL